ncbi:MAG: response regulator transcription factor [Actinobacteria bacterium]|nr:response regulator transcription factor [Actinomycetota bacterium]
MTERNRGLVVVVEDEPAIADLLTLYLERDGFQVEVVGDGNIAIEVILDRNPAAVILDVGLPGQSGTDVCAAMRLAQNWTPVLFCTARDDEIDRVLGLELGADDYITKPFSPREVVARVKAVLRRSAGAAAPEPKAELAMNGVAVDTATRRCLVNGFEIELTPTEFDLLVFLLRNPGKVFGRDELLTDVWGYSSAVGSRTVDVHVAQLRSKLEPVEIIRTVRGVGYSVDERAS